MPVVISVMVTIIFLSFYVYNRMAAEQDAYILAFRESIQKTKDAGISHLLSRVSSQTDRTYIGPDKPVFSAEDTGDSYAVSAKGKMNGWDFAVKKSAWKYDPPEKIRRFRRLTYIARELGDLMTKEE